MYNNYIYLMNDLLDTTLSSFLWRVFIHTKCSLKKIKEVRLKVVVIFVK